VLKGIPVNQFMETMGFFSAALGYNCTNCHGTEVLGNWEKYANDTPVKQTARRMVIVVNTIKPEPVWWPGSCDLLYVPSGQPNAQGRSKSPRTIQRAARG
jgi:hypothetical protein